MSEKDSQIKDGNQEVAQEIFTKENKFTKFLITYGLLIITILVFVAFSLLAPRFMTTRNIVNLLTQGAIIGMLGLGLTNIVISGNFDISFAHNAAFSAIVVLFLLGQFKLPIYLAYLITIALSLTISLINGIIVVYFKVPSFVGTLGMQSVLLGLAKWLTKGSVKMFPYLPTAFTLIGKGKISNIFPYALLIFLIVAVLLIIFLELTYKGRQFYAVGSNVPASSRVGIKINRIKFQAFIIMGLIAGISGIVMGSLFEAANPLAAESFLFPSLIVALLGAVFLKEGVPNVLGTTVAAVLMAALANGFTMLGYPLWVKEVTQGIVLLIAVAILSTLKPGGIPPVVIGAGD